MADLRSIFRENLPNPGYCLVLRPFGKEFDRVWAEIEKALRNTFKWTDVANLNGAGEIMHEVLLAIAQTDAVIVDVTEDNPNVFYELGIARMAKSEEKVVLVKQQSTNLLNPRHVPFDIRGDRYLEYESTPKGIRAILPELEARIKKALEWTVWFRLAEGETFREDPLPGTDGEYQFDVCAVSFTGDKNLGQETVRIVVTVRSYPASDAAPPAVVQTRLFRRASCEIPNIPWRLKFEGFDVEHGKKKAIICVIPEGTT